MNQAFMLCALDSMQWDAKSTVYFSAMAVQRQFHKLPGGKAFFIRYIRSRKR